MKKILVIGSKGMAGHIIYHYLKENTDFNIIDIARDDEFFKPTHKVDVTRFDKLQEILGKERPDVVINCIGILNKDAEDNPDRAILLNSYLPHFLAKQGDKTGFKLIHISTDCVFSGKKGGYTENAEKDGMGFYAQSKALGEVAEMNKVQDQQLHQATS
jgi:dTDP-4-dehydrorhamnose reductase